MLVSFLAWMPIQNLEELILKLLVAVLIKNKIFKVHSTDSKVLENFMMISNSMMLLGQLSSEVMAKRLCFLLILHMKNNGVLLFEKLIWNLIQDLNQSLILNSQLENLNLIIKWKRDIVRKPMHQDFNQIINFGMQHLGQQKKILTLT